jgi:Rrf2 family protein
MPVLFSRACEYALRAMFEMARRPQQKFWTVQELAKRTETPAPFLAKTFQSLVKNEILISIKGRHGGFAFARPPQKIFLMEIVEVIDGPALALNCALGLPACSNNDPCPFHAQWKNIREAISSALRNQTLAQGASQTTPRRNSSRRSEA